jgi:hypothetical protein
MSTIFGLTVGTRSIFHTSPPNEENGGMVIQVQETNLTIVLFHDHDPLKCVQKTDVKYGIVKFQDFGKEEHPESEGKLKQVR